MQKVQGGKNSNNKTMKRFGLRIWDAMSGNVDGVKPSWYTWKDISSDISYPYVLDCTGARFLSSAVASKVRCGGKFASLLR